ncbi:MAG: hypothetical protein ACTSW3_02965 [Promethearchaeota archaeon]
MSESIEEFMVFELEDNGESRKIKIKQEELGNYLNPEQVLIIVREDLRRIYIWKGSMSPVRKRFISSRVAQELQHRLMRDYRYHRCKIVSIDQGDELEEFLKAFNLKSMEVKERLPDMKYVRNIEKDRVGKVIDNTTIKQDNLQEGYFSPALENTSEDVIMSSVVINSQTKKPELIINKSPYVDFKKTAKMQSLSPLSEEEKEKIKKKILEMEVPENYERKNLILGHSLYGAISKVSEVFDKSVVDVEWEEIKKFPSDMIELSDHKFRVFLNQEKGIVEAIEVLKRKN